MKGGAVALDARIEPGDMILQVTYYVIFSAEDIILKLAMLVGT